jgi:hypothetical protein
MATAVRGDVLRLLGAEDSIAGQLSFWLVAHGRNLIQREIPVNDASRSSGLV